MLAEQGILSISLLLLIVPAATLHLSAQPSLTDEELGRSLARLDAPSLAFLRDGPDAIIEMTVVSLLYRGALGDDKGRLSPSATNYRRPAPDSELNALERRVLSAVEGEPGLTLDMLVERCASTVDTSKIRTHLIDTGLWLDAQAHWEQRMLVRWCSVLALGLSLWSLAASKAVGAMLPCLFALCCLGALLVPSYLRAVHGRPLSAKGKALLRMLAGDCALRRHVQRRSHRLSRAQLAFAHAAFGAGSAQLTTAPQPKQPE